ncbi:alpha/beta fold hydrolase [Massilia yuzhufengensis]|uniref:Pimeloyl-ACP methyl ester carboxylesterase n=1 Tax=Massilia yuzhufengensis TaxID=1164594 RepID=A0A1I1M162_9BURK|nr:alpha/beta hydrolase [Massilia yuzhufengensis]SFC79114.1 Pimeloyl-ACP methyl ester carboxylesterase [Massilia yuzhufengensis]
MQLEINGATAYAYTGGKAFDPSLPTFVFIHGAQNDHSVWALQSRYMAHHGYSVLAVDLPGHGRSSGPALATVEAMADWLLELMKAADVQRAILAGHSMGSLIALEASRRAPEPVIGLALVGSTYPMKVSDALLETSRTDEAAAIDMVNIWSHSSIAQKPSCPGPGFSVMGGARRLMQRMSARNPDGLFHTDFAACNSYAGGEAAAAAVRCPVLFVFGNKDMMTPPRSTKLLTGAIAHGKITIVDAGHQMMAEAPDAVLDALAGFAATIK